MLNNNNNKIQLRERFENRHEKLKHDWNIQTDIRVLIIPDSLILMNFSLNRGSGSYYMHLLVWDDVVVPKCSEGRHLP
jgi:hypothetical protein